MFKNILIVILILLFIGVLHRLWETADMENYEEVEEEAEEDLEGFSFDNKNAMIEGARGRRRRGRGRRPPPRREPRNQANDSFIKLQGKVKELQHEIYDLKNDVKTNNTSFSNKLNNVVEKDDLENEMKSYQRENKKILENSEKKQNNKINSIYLDNKVDKLEEQKKDSAYAKAVEDKFSKYN
tara:strand:+ start:1470 stop:2018 length:549 start_codon:yes stop_codon:yes gene_type:complete